MLRVLYSPPMRRILFALFLLAVSAAFVPLAAQQPRVPASRAEIQLSFAPVAKRAAPAVVNIHAMRMVRQTHPFFDDPFFRRFFGEGFGIPSERAQRSLGSGVIVNPSGIVVTNHHVIEGAEAIRVALADRREFDAEVLLRDPRSDLAVLRIKNGRERFPVIEFGDSDQLEVGDIVLAIGNPFGVGQTVTQGIVSAVARTQIGVTDYQFFIQTDAAINPGNSGGPLLDSAGRVIGVTTAIYSPSGAYAGLGFAVPIDTVARVAPQLIANGRAPIAGIGILTANQSLTARLGLEGVLVWQVGRGSPAERAGLRSTDPQRGLVGDVIVEANGQPVRRLADLTSALDRAGVGGTVNLTVQRGDQRVDVPVAVEDIGASEASGK